MSLPIRTYNLRRTHGRNVSNSLGIQLALLTKMLPHNGDGAYGSVTSIVAPAQVPVTQAATGRSTGQQCTLTWQQVSLNLLQDSPTRLLMYLNELMSA